ncbi:type II toxin-antitoxin system RelE/ParE family toxin [Prosthecobacter vanneervenii]|uniref:Plasmid stabilization system protein ParE n=1 Tax=Prosthecobacter vanneervenii TaxID=48466 RepID=A0A7W7YDP5_9BACT|nr:plasmid stabilization system protein ParE [Prosthecobacter vanneervenii]
MKIPVVILAGAESDIQHIYNRLSDQRDGAGDDFMEQLGGVIRQLEIFPQSAPQRMLGFRRALVPGYVYGLYYQIEPRGIMVHLIADLRQDPDMLLQKLRERLE